MHEREVSAQGKFNCMTTATELSLSASKTRARPRARLSFPPTLRDDYFARDLLSFLLSPRNCGRWPVCKYRKFAPRTRTGTKGDEVGDMSSSSSAAAAAAAAPRQTLLPFYVALPSSPGGNSTEGSHHGMKSQYISPIYAAGHLGCQGRTGHGNERVARISQRKKAACGQIVLVRSELREDGRVSGGEVDVMRM